jgi:hypothetical protein
MNEYLAKFTEAEGDSYAFDLRLRHGWCCKYAWSVPNEEALETIAALGPIIEIGAGTGYWAHLLRSLYKVNVLAYDKYPVSQKPNRYHKGAKAWTGVLPGRPVKAGKHPDRALMLCWPPYDTPMGYEALKAYKGSTVVYIGESAWGCTGDAAFHRLLDEEWTEQKHVRLPNYGGIHDTLTVYTRKSV